MIVNSSRSLSAESQQSRFFTLGDVDDNDDDVDDEDDEDVEDDDDEDDDDDPCVTMIITTIQVSHIEVKRERMMIDYQ